MFWCKSRVCAGCYFDTLTGCFMLFLWLTSSLVPFCAARHGHCLESWGWLWQPCRCCNATRTYSKWFVNEEAVKCNQFEVTHLADFELIGLMTSAKPDVSWLGLRKYLVCTFDRLHSVESYAENPGNYKNKRLNLFCFTCNWAALIRRGLTSDAVSKFPLLNLDMLSQ